MRRIARIRWQLQSSRLSISPFTDTASPPSCVALVSRFSCRGTLSHRVERPLFSQHIRTFVGLRQPAAQSEVQYSQRSGKEPWEPERHYLEALNRSWHQDVPTLNELIREDIGAARHFFRSVLQVMYPREMRMWNKWGVMEWKAGNYDLARMIFQKASKISFHPDLWQSWASMEFETKNFREAKRLFKVILATDPQNADAGLGMALLEAAMGNKTKARTLFQELHETHPDDHLILQAYGVFEAKQQNMSMARQIFESATDHEHATAQVWHAWAQAELTHGFFKNALAVANRGLSLFPTNKWLMQAQATALYKLDKVMDARRVFRRLIDGTAALVGTTDHLEPAAYNAYAKMEEEVGNVDAAMAIYAEVLSIFPTHIPSLMALAILHAKRGHLTNGRRVFEHAMKRGKASESGSLCIAWGQFEEQYGELKNARELYEEATQQTPTNVDAWKGLARAESALGNVDAARTVLTMATQHIPQDAMLLVQLAKIEQTHRNLRGARRALENALQVDPTNAAVWNLRALLELSSYPERTKHMVETALPQIPSYEKTSLSILYCTYGRALMALEQTDEAIEAFKTSFEIAPKNWKTHLIYAETVLLPHEAYDDAKRHLQAAWRLCRQENHHDERKVAQIAKKLQRLQQQQATAKQNAPAK